MLQPVSREELFRQARVHVMSQVIRAHADTTNAPGFRAVASLVPVQIAEDRLVYGYFSSLTRPSAFDLYALTLEPDPRLGPRAGLIRSSPEYDGHRVFDGLRKIRDVGPLVPSARNLAKHLAGLSDVDLAFRVASWMEAKDRILSDFRQRGLCRRTQGPLLTVEGLRRDVQVPWLYVGPPHLWRLKTELNKAQLEGLRFDST
ncbi:hypothetical protein HY572_02130 [Candidatus Micrarchaeota archaeon]|nr:hypothetical protein [Candidatus Micrarchaeota archaeon]